MGKNFYKQFVLLTATLSLAAALALMVPRKAEAIPAFSRQYGTSCSTCHVNFPKLNDFGKAFKDAGFKFPKDDETFIKVPPVMLGAQANKELWPRSIWPGTIPGLPPIGLRYNSFFQVTGRNRGNFNALNPPGTVSQFIPRTDFSSGLFSIFTAGNFGSDIAFWVDDDISVSGDNAAGGLGDAYLKFVNIGRFMKMPKDSLSLRVGQFELDLPFSQARTYNLSGYDIYQQANFGAVNPAFLRQQNVSNQFTMGDVGRGVELSGGHNYGGYHYSIAVIDQNTSGVSQADNNSPFVPSPTGSNNGGVGFASDSNFKDIYARLAYRFNLERDKASRNDVQAAGPMGPRDHTSLRLGSYYFYGRSVQRFSGITASDTATVLTAREPFYRAGGDFNFSYRNLNFYGLYMYGHDNNLLPVDTEGGLITLPLSDQSSPAGFIKGTPATFSGGFLQADYMIHPWLMALIRYDAVNSSADRINGLAQSASPSFLLPYSSTRNRITPGVQFLIHANIKTSFEYQFRPQQSVVFVNDPLTGLPKATNPFRTNTAVVGLEFVY
jgi:hypothetical protein